MLQSTICCIKSVVLKKIVLINTLVLQEAKDSSEIENIVILVQEIKKLMDDYKQKLRPLFGAKYNNELLNNLFRHPYTKI